MFQLKGNEAVESFPNVKLMIPINESAKDAVFKKLSDLGMSLSSPLPDNYEPGFLLIKNQVIGYTSDFDVYEKAEFKDISIIELLAWERVPLKMTLKEISKEISQIIGHDVEIIEGGK